MPLLPRPAGLLLILCSFPVRAESLLLPDAAEIRRLNEQIASRARQTGRAASQAETIEALLARRRPLLEAWMRWQPAEAARLALPRELAGQVRAATGSPDVEEYGEWEGPAALVVADDFERQRSAASVWIGTAGGPLEAFPTNALAPARGAGLRATLRGFRLGGAAAGEIRLQAATPRGEDAGGCSNLGEQRFLVIPVTAPGVENAPDRASLEETFFAGNGASVASHWRESSYGKAWVSGRVAETVRLSREIRSYGIGELANEAIRLAADKEDISAYRRFVLAYPFDVQTAGAAAIATVGCPALAPGNDAPVSLIWLDSQLTSNRRFAAHVAVHEAGHTLGLGHAHQVEHPDGVLGPPGDQGLRVEYGSQFSPMGFIWDRVTDYSAPEKFIAGWLGEDEFVEVRDNGEALLAPLSGPGPGVRALRVLRDEKTSEWLWLEYRRRDGTLDSELPDAADGAVMVLLETSYLGPANHLPATGLLDMTPETPQIAFPWDRNFGLAPGRPWADPYSPVSLEAQMEEGGMRVRAARQPRCAALASATALHGPGEETGEIRIVAPPDCAWQALSHASWLKLEGPAEGAGSAIIPYRVAAIEDRVHRGAAVTVSGLVFRAFQFFPAAGFTGMQLQPERGEGRNVEIEASWAHAGTSSALYAARLRLEPQQEAAAPCEVEYFPQWRSARVRMDDGTWSIFTSPLTPMLKLRNSACSLSGIDQLSGSYDPALRLRFRLELRTQDPAGYSLALAATDRYFREAGRRDAGFWQVSDSLVPVLTDVAGLAEGGGPDLWLNARLFNPRGPADTGLLRFVIVDRSQLESSCALEINTERFEIRLGYSPEEGWSDWDLFIGAASLANSRCRLHRVDWIETGRPGEAWVFFSLNFLPAFSGKKEVYAQIVSRDGREWDWTLLGPWEVRVPGP